MLLGSIPLAARCLLYFIPTAIVVSLLFLFGLPFYTNKYSCIAQVKFGNHTGIWLHKKSENFTGVLRIWDEHGVLQFVNPYSNGKRNGTWRSYDSNGVLEASCVYSNDLPWDGWCHPMEYKAWIGEYRSGKPWNGRLPIENPTGSLDWLYFIDGREFSESEYKLHFKLSSNSIVMGVHHFR
jgi:hypothetical protein